jgi:DNA adenine methylase
MQSQIGIFNDIEVLSRYSPPKYQLLKWVGNKQKFASAITNFFPTKFNTYIEPFLGSGAILATVAPNGGIGSDTFKPLVEIWQTLKSNPKKLINWYAERRELIVNKPNIEVYNEIRESYNKKPNGADFLYLSRSCYGGVVRFRKIDGYMSTPCGVHTPIDVNSFKKRVLIWHNRTKSSNFFHQDYKETFKMARKGDLIYCDPPYSYSQGILYGAQNFDLMELFFEIQRAKRNGVFVALSIDGSKKSGNFICNIPIPENLFERQFSIHLGRSMLKRFQMEGKSMENEDVSDRLLLTY